MWRYPTRFLSNILKPYFQLHAWNSNWADNTTSGVLWCAEYRLDNVFYRTQWYTYPYEAIAQALLAIAMAQHKDPTVYVGI